MPKYNPSDEEMETYGSTAPSPSPDDSETPAETQSVDEENAGSSEILIAKNKLPSGTKEGDECTFRVSKDFGDEVSLEYVGEGEDESESTEPPDSVEVGELAALSEEGE